MEQALHHRMCRSRSTGAKTGQIVHFGRNSALFTESATLGTNTNKSQPGLKNSQEPAGAQAFGWADGYGTRFIL